MSSYQLQISLYWPRSPLIPTFTTSMTVWVPLMVPISRHLCQLMSIQICGTGRGSFPKIASLCVTLISFLRMWWRGGTTQQQMRQCGMRHTLTIWPFLRANTSSLMLDSAYQAHFLFCIKEFDTIWRNGDKLNYSKSKWLTTAGILIWYALAH